MNMIQESFANQFAIITCPTFQGRYNYKRHQLKNKLTQTIQKCRQTHSFQLDNFLKLENSLQKNQLNLRFFALMELYLNMQETIEKNQVASQGVQCVQEGESAPDFLLDMRQLQRDIISYIDSTLTNNFFTII